FLAWTKTNAWAATYARWFVRWTAASPWTASKLDGPLNRGSRRWQRLERRGRADEHADPERHCGHRRVPVSGRQFGGRRENEGGAERDPGEGSRSNHERERLAGDARRH